MTNPASQRTNRIGGFTKMELFYKDRRGHVLASRGSILIFSEDIRAEGNDLPSDMGKIRLGDIGGGADGPIFLVEALREFEPFVWAYGTYQSLLAGEKIKKGLQGWIEVANIIKKAIPDRQGYTNREGALALALAHLGQSDLREFRLVAYRHFDEYDDVLDEIPPKHHTRAICLSMLQCYAIGVDEYSCTHSHPIHAFKFNDRGQDIIILVQGKQVRQYSG